jgi:nucleoside phosphorylase
MHFMKTDDNIVSKPLTLVIAAHFGEVQELLHHFELERVPSLSSTMGSLWGSQASDNKNENSSPAPSLLVAITGEGCSNALRYTSYLLGRLDQQISEIINVGVAGAIDHSLVYGELLWIRSVYSQRAGITPEFKSFSTNHKHSTNVDCISVTDRILAAEAKDHLKAHATVIDRELWSIAMAAQGAGISWRSLKIISDTHNQPAHCESIQQNAREFSQKLLQALLPELQTILSSKNLSKNQTHQDQHTLIDRKAQASKLKLTTSMRQRFVQRLKILAHDRQSGLEDEFDRVVVFCQTSHQNYDELAPKKRALIAMETVEQMLDPARYEWLARVSKQLRQLIPPSKQGGQLNLAPDYHSGSLKLSALLGNNDERDQLLKELARLDCDQVLNQNSLWSSQNSARGPKHEV